MKNLCTFLIFILGTLTALAQQEATLSGYVTDQKTGEPLIGATVRLDETELGSVTDLNGFYQIKNIVPQAYSVTASYVGYEKLTKFQVMVRSAANPELNFQLSESTETLDDIVISANPFEKLPETPLSIQKLSAEEIATYPGGNNDIAKVVQSLPGVAGSVGGFRNDVIIRGGAPNENVYYLDGVEIPNINHFSTQGSAGGPVGLLNVSFIESVDLATSAFNARYDNPLSGVLQFNQRTGNSRDFRGNVRVSASETALTAEGPLFKGEQESAKTSYIVSVRRSYLQFLFQLIGLPILPDYWDYQYKITHKIDQYNEINFLGVGAIDDFQVNSPDDFDPEQQATLEQVPIIKQYSTTAGLSWKRRFKDGSGFMTTVLSTNLLDNSFNRFRDNENQQGLYFSNESRETERKLRYEQTRFLGEWTITGGLVLQQAIYENETFNEVENFNYRSDLNFWRYGLFLQTSRAYFNERLNFSFGVRTDANTFTSQKNQILETISPRASISYALDKAQTWRVNASVGRYFKLPPYTILGFNYENQFVNQDAEYIQSDHLVAGLEYLVSPSARITLEGFLKLYDNYPVSLRDSVSLANQGGGFEVLGNEPIVSTGKGRSYGLEFLFQQKLSRNFYGILAYTLFWSEFSGLNDEYLPSVWDSRHLLTFTGGYKFGNNWEVSLRNRFVGPTPYVPVDQDASLAQYPAIILDYDRLGEEQLPVFNQADIRIDKRLNFNRFSLDLYLELQNVLGQNAPSPPSFGLDRDEAGVLLSPRRLVAIEQENSGTLPIIGFVIDF